MNKVQEWLRRDGWLVAVLALCVALCAVAGLGEQKSGGSTAETRLAQVLQSVEGAGRVEVALYFAPGEGENPCGALVVADGAGDIGVQLNLHRAVTSLLGVDNNAVQVLKRGTK